MLQDKWKTCAWHEHVSVEQNPATNDGQKGKLMKPPFQRNLYLLTKSCTQTILLCCCFLSLCGSSPNAVLRRSCEPQSHRLIAMPASISWESSPRLIDSNKKQDSNRWPSCQTQDIWATVFLCQFFLGERWKYFSCFAGPSSLFESGHLRETKRNRSTIQFSEDWRPRRTLPPMPIRLNIATRHSCLPPG